jgi:hypothetical protein
VVLLEVKQACVIDVPFHPDEELHFRASHRLFEIGGGPEGLLCHHHFCLQGSAFDAFDAFGFPKSPSPPLEKKHMDKNTVME